MLVPRQRLLEYPYYTAAVGTRVLSALPDQAQVDRRTAWQFLDDQRAAGQDIAVPVCAAFVNLVQPGNLVPLSGFPNRRTLLGNELGFFATYFADRHGFNNPDSVYDSQSNPPTVVLLGDSYTHGFAVNPGDDIAGQLREHGFSAFNLGCGGNGPLAELAAYVEYGRVLRPDNVILIYYEGNDLFDVASEWKTVLRRYLDADFTQALLEREDERLATLQTVADARPASRAAGVLHRLITLRHLRQRVEAVVNPRRFDIEVRRFTAVVERLQAELTEQGIEFSVVYLPHGSTMAGGRGHDDCRVHPGHCKGRVLAVLRDLNVPVLDFEAVLRDREDPFDVFPYRRGNEVLGHLNAEGYKILAQAIAETIGP